MGGILKFLNHKWFNIVLRNYFGFRTNFMKRAIPFVMATFCSQNLHSAPQTPSQALPKMFQKQPSLDYYQFKKQEQIIPELPAIDIKQQEDTGIKIIPETLIILAPKDKYFDKTISNMQEVIARGGKVLLISDKHDDVINENIRFKIEMPFIDELLNPFLLTIPLQLLAYHVALLKKCDIDKPRNLAKSVTVE